ncbi:MAG: hypothetical protein DRP22_04155 [Verrucomicrobia bacterium]|nr:MAG: hypothetical protein DRP22_04155 [Verrucomicrobiota bacterium]
MNRLFHRGQVPIYAFETFQAARAQFFKVGPPDRNIVQLLGQLRQLPFAVLQSILELVQPQVFSGYLVVVGLRNGDRPITFRASDLHARTPPVDHQALSTMGTIENYVLLAFRSVHYLQPTVNQ